MKIDIRETDDLLVRYGKEIEGVLRRAVLKALQEHKRAGNPVATWRDGRVLLIDPADIPDDDEVESPAM